MPVIHPVSRYGWELIAIFSFGVVFVIVLVLVALTLPSPTEFQQLIFRIVLALAAAGIGALIPGLLTIRIKNLLRAGGALGVFVVVYFFNPATYVVQSTSNPTDSFTITIVIEQNENLVTNTYSFPISDIEKKVSGESFFKLLEQLPNVPVDSIKKSTVFRTSDEAIVTEESGNALENRNTGVLVIPNSVIQQYKEPHLAFTHIYNQVQSLK